MSTNEDRGVPGLQYPQDLHTDSVPVQKAIKMTVDNLFYLHRQVQRLIALGAPPSAAQQIISQTVNQISGSGGGGGGSGGAGGGLSAVVHVSTHSVRIVSFSSAADPVGSIFFETDRCSIYYVSDSTGINRWVFAAGMMTGAFAVRPADLGADDAGFSFVATDLTELTHYLWTGTRFITTGGLRQVITDAITAASSDLFRMAHRSSGVPAVNFGGKFRVELDNALNVLVDGTAVDSWWTNATSGAETSALALQLRNAGAALADYFQLLINGIRFKVGGFFGKLTHANSADRTYTMPNADGNITYETAVLTNNNFLFGGGGPLVKDAGFAIVPVANGGTGIAYDRVADTVAAVAQVAIIGSTNFANGGVGSTFRVSYYIETTTADAAAGTIQLQVAFTDAAGATTVASATVSLALLSRTSGVFFIQRQSGNVAYQTLATGIFGTSQYALYICFERLS